MKMKKRICFFAMYCLPIWASQTFPQTLPEVVVKSSENPPQPIMQQSINVTIKAAEIKRQQYRELPDALRSQPEVSVAQSGGAGHQAAIFIRGLDARHTAFIQDGIRLDTPASYDGAVDLGPLSLDGISSLQIIHGPAAMMYGGDILGGLVQLKTQKGSGPLVVSGALEGGSFRTHRETASIKGQQGRFCYAVNASRFQTIGTISTPKSQRTHIQGSPYDPFLSENWLSRFDVDANRDLSVGLISRYQSGRVGFRHERYKPYRTYQELYSHRLQMKGKLWHTVVMKVGLSQSRSAYEDKTEKGMSISDNMGMRTQADARWKWTASPQHTLYFMMDYMKQRMTNRWDTNRIGAENTQWGMGMRHLYRLMDSIIVDMALRKDYITHFHAPITWHAQVRYEIFSKTLLQASYGASFKAPSLYYLYAQSPYYQGNPFLKPEKGLGGDASITHTFWERPSGVHIAGDLTYFWNDIQELIQNERISGEKSTSVNVGKMSTRGMIARLKAKTPEGWMASASYTHTKAYDVRTKASLLRRPRHKWTGEIGYDHSPWQASVGIIINSRYWDLDPVTWKKQKGPGYTLLTMKGSYALSKNMDVFGRIENALNRSYQNPRGYQQPGFAVYAGIRGTL